MSALKKDVDGNVILKEPLSKKVSVITLLVFSSALTLVSVVLLFFGNFTVGNIVRILIGGVIAAFSLYALIKERTVYVITKEKLVCYGKWELMLKEIDGVTLNKLKFFKTLAIESHGAEYTILQSDVSVPLEDVAQLLAKRLKKNKK